MAAQFEIINNALVVTDTSNSDVLLDVTARDTYYNSSELDDGNVVLYDTNSVNPRSSVVFRRALTDTEDSAGTTFTATTFRTFARQNLGFSSASGGSGARTTNVLNGSPFADFAALETYSQANLSELINSSTEVAVATVTGVAVYEWAGEDTPASYTNNWIVRQNLSDSTSMISEGFVPRKVGSNLVDSSLRETATQLISTKTIVAPDASLVVGNWSMSNGGFFLGFEELTEQRTFYNVITELETAGTNNPYYWGLSAIVTAPSLTPDSESVTGTSIQWVRPVSQTGVGLQYIFRSDIDTDDVNLVVRLNSHTDPIPIFDYQRATGELFDITTGNNTLPLPVPLFFEVGKDLYVTVESVNNISLRGDSGVPYLEIQGRSAAQIQMATQNYVDNAIAGIMPTPSDSGRVEAFSIQGQSTAVNAPFTISGSQTFNYRLNNPNLFTGDLTISQGSNVISSTVSRTATSVSVNVNSETLNTIGDNAVFTLSGTDTDGNTESRIFTIHVVGSDELVYYGLSTSDNPNNVGLADLESHTVGTGSLSVETGTVTNGDYFIVLVPTDHDIHTIHDDVLNEDVTSFFTKTTNVRSINSVQYNSYVIGALNADANGETYTLNLL